MSAASPLAITLPGAPSCLEIDAPQPPPEPFTPAELFELVRVGGGEAEDLEKILAQCARVQAALDLAIGDGLAALTVGDRLISLGFSCLRDYAREVLDVAQRTAESMAQLSRGLRSRPILRAAVRAGEVRPRAALVVLPVAVGEAEAAWVELARTETVRALEKAVRAVRRGVEDDEWTRFRVWLAPEDRAIVDEALAVAGKVTPGSTRPERLEAIAQEYLGGHPVQAGDDGGGDIAGSFRPDGRDGVERRRAQLELQTDRWSYLEEVVNVRAPDDGASELEQMKSAREIDRALRDLAARRNAWDRVVGYCAYAVKKSRLHLVAGFESFEHYASERLGLAARTVEQRAVVERRLWEVPALREARDDGLAYEKVRLLSRLPAGELEEWLSRARELTAIALRAELEQHDETQMRAARKLRSTVPVRIALTLQAGFRAVRAAEGRLLDDGRCLVRMARHFIDTWRRTLQRGKTLSQKVRERDLGRCQVPGCSRRAVHAHHVEPRSHGGADTEENLVALCACHHLRGIHGGYIRVWGRAPDQLVWVVGGRVWIGGRIGGASGAQEG